MIPGYSGAVSRKRVLGVLAAAALIAGCSGTTAPEQAGVPPVPDRLPALVFAKNGALHISEPAGSPSRALTDGPGDTDPTVSPDGRRVAYVHRMNPEEPGGELRVLDISSGESRRLVDPAALVPRFDGDQTQITTPRWSPAGDRIAFLKATYGGGGFLLTAAADTGEVTAPPEPLFADFGYSWSPDGRRIAWSGGRSDVSPVDVSIYTVGETSTPVARDTNATAVSYSPDGRSVVFANSDANSDATGSAFANIPFELREGGIYSVGPGERPVPLLAGAEAFADVQALPAGAVAVTMWSGDQRRKDIAIVENGNRRDVAETPGDAPAPAWMATGAATLVAYIGTDADRPLLVRKDGDAPIRLDTAVDAYAWGPAHAGEQAETGR